MPKGAREASGKKAGTGRAGLSEDPSFAAGWEAIFKREAPGAGGGPTESTASVADIGGWFRTEDPAWLNEDAIADIQTKLQAGDPSLWHQPVEVAVIDGRTFVLNGHHRLTAAARAGYTGRVPIARIAPPGDFQGQHFGTFGGR